MYWELLLTKTGWTARESVNFMASIVGIGIFAGTVSTSLIQTSRLVLSVADAL